MKMWRITIILILSLAFCDRIQAKENIDEELMKIEYSIFSSVNDTLRNILICKKFNYCLAQGRYDAQTFLEAKRVDHKLLPDSLQWKYLWNASLLAHLNNDRDYSSFYLNRLEELKRDTLYVERRILRVYQNIGDDTLIAGDLGHLLRIDSLFACLGCLANINHNDTTDQENHFILASAIIPGSGMMLNGYFVKGITALILNASVGFVVYLFLKEALVINAVGWGGALFTKFYVGNLKLTNVLYQKKKEKVKSEQNLLCYTSVKMKLQKYPLRFL
ncbi:MAG: hypothetical protein NT150_04325 [Bacteroidetes bacterium]|nr:hypothetical protein [Bacteroidota bacterium]